MVLPLSSNVSPPLRTFLSNACAWQRRPTVFAQPPRRKERRNNVFYREPLANGPAPRYAKPNKLRLIETPAQPIVAGWPMGTIAVTQICHRHRALLPIRVHGSVKQGVPTPHHGAGSCQRSSSRVMADRQRAKHALGNPGLGRGSCSGGIDGRPLRAYCWVKVSCNSKRARSTIARITPAHGPQAHDPPGR